MKSNVIILTGGGTAGHVMPHLAILSELRDAGFDPHYVGSGGIEKDLANKAQIPFHQIATGKLRRYASVDNFLDVFKIFLGFIQALVLVARLRPVVVFSKGGFVAVPVTIAAWFFRVPVVTHESDYSPGLANRIIAPFSKKILFTFPETASYLSAAKAIHVGTPVRPELFLGDSVRGRTFCQLSRGLPILLVMGGSQGAQRINSALSIILPELLKTFDVVHLTGKGKSVPFAADGYRSFEFLGPELKDVFAAASLVVSRSGANSIFELLALKKPMLLVPLEIGSRGDQVLNARSFVAHGWARSLSETQLTPELFLTAIQDTWTAASIISNQQNEIALQEVPRRIVEILRQQRIV
jgi:UDP-N-acetylglucosamine--N-acetylmuramyl-(pentapeptide) pyrophosphoryl-undecaprenol N-acetylglucosamine transferase